MRRLLILGAPVALVLWLVVALVLLVATVIKQIVEPLAVLWNAPPRHMLSETAYFSSTERHNEGRKDGIEL